MTEFLKIVFARDLNPGDRFYTMSGGADKAMLITERMNIEAPVGPVAVVIGIDSNDEPTYQHLPYHTAVVITEYVNITI